MKLKEAKRILKEHKKEVQSVTWEQIDKAIDTVLKELKLLKKENKDLYTEDNFIHDKNQVLAREKSGTLKVWQEDKELKFRFNIPESRIETLQKKWNEYAKAHPTSGILTFRTENTDKK